MMQKLIIRTFIYVSLLFSLFAGTIVLYHVLTPNMLQPSDGYFVEDYYKVFNMVPSADVLILGNSKVLAALSAEELGVLANKKVLNLGFAAASLAHNKMVLEAYLKRCRNVPKTLILEVSWFSFSTRRTNFHPYFAARVLSVDWTPVKYMIRYPEIIQQMPWQLFNYYMTKNKYAGLSFKMHQTYRMKNNPREKSYVFDPKEMEATFPEYRAGVNKDLVKDFYDIIKMCNENKIQLILFNAPEDREFTTLQRDKIDVQSIFDRAIQENQLNYFDFTLGGKYYMSKMENLLADSHHIFYTERFTKIFYNIVIKDIKL
ncbi:MAG: hypothetical protein A2Y40_05345 [Candidatus Margulisbacteria bacterium GWF2_35_9]|nr:MAG: hypothetical protein A2Y40_05345 [Candidatus Margulisbacteria bacterium GWF2_35_9]